MKAISVSNGHGPLHWVRITPMASLAFLGAATTLPFDWSKPEADDVVRYLIPDEGWYRVELHTELNRVDMALELKEGQKILVHRNGDVFVDSYTPEEIDGAIEDLRNIVKELEWLG